MEEFDLVAKRQIGDDIGGDRADLAPRLDPEPVDRDNRTLLRIKAGRDLASVK